jgi:ferredoxin
MTYLVEIDAAACAAHGDCVDLAPEVFELHDVARVVGTGPDELLMAAAEACPSAAIRVLDPRTNEELYP